ncbi:hypothetical protein FJT64_025105 [Amphibalanus amphitrite]|uniref:Uncharacterized protein n=1 Tax=Amphibalanus amphitrite TaxID=1232801 RepID=A0A6A4WLQ9_AMPAM|nr:hypothetical protein FJT64_025105 [Amphibalanus amphitrite]
MLLSLCLTFRAVISPSSLMRQDNELFRQLLSLHDSIEALKHGDGSLSAGSSLCSLADIEEEDTISTPSTDLDRQSHLSTETDNLSLVKGDSGSERSFFSEILHVTGMSQWAKTRLLGPAGLTTAQVAPPSPRQAAPSPHSPGAEKAPLRRHRKQGSCDSGIVDQEIRGQA